MESPAAAVQFLITELSSLAEITRATRVGSSCFAELQTFSSDIDLIFNVKTWEPERLVSLLKAKQYDFFTKHPRRLCDMRGDRIEFYLRLGSTIYDVTLIPNEIPGLDMVEEAARDFLDIHVGNLYVHGEVFYRNESLDDFVSKHFLPFYNEVTVERRLRNIDWKIEKIKRKTAHVATLDVFQLVQLRELFIRRLFITQRKYPFSYEQYLDYQLTRILNFDGTTTDTLLGRNLPISAAVDDLFHAFQSLR